MDWAVILAGGSGTRFWPLSSPRHPKQLLPLAGPVPTAVAAVDILETLVPRERILVVTSVDLAGPLGDAMGLPGENFLQEPRPASTGPALVWATTVVRQRDPDAAILSLHADWQLGDGRRFLGAARSALEAARAQDALLTVGVVPTRIEPGYGYIVPGEVVAGAVHRVAAFREKPDPETAGQLIADGARWNSGLFAWTASRFLAEVAAVAPEIAPALPRLEAGDVSGFYAAVTPVAIDVALFERSPRVLTLSGDFPWDDVGTWEALARLRPSDSAGNTLVGPVYPVDAQGCIAWSDGTPMVLSGVEDLIVVHANGRILVLDRSRAPDLKRTLDALPPEVRDLG